MENKKKETPEGRIFGLLPYYKNPFKPDGTLKGWMRPFLYALPFAVLIGIKNYFQL